MAKTYFKITIFTLILIGFFIYIGEALTRISGGDAGSKAAVGVNPEAGENIFWGKGRCGTCHSIGNRGSAVRCPNLNDIGGIVAERAAKGAARGVPGMSATDLLVESIVDPGAYITENFKNEMPLVFQPPIALNAEEIRAVISFMQSLGGEVDIAAIKLPDEILRGSAEPPEPWKPYLTGDPEAGEYHFFDDESNAACSKCHVAVDSSGITRGSKTGPDLTSLAGTRTPQFIIDSIVNPNAEIGSGYEQILIITKDGQYMDGIPIREDDTSIVLSRMQGNEVVEITIAKDQIETRAPQTTSMMPGNYSEILTMQEFHDIMAYLMSLK
ncbi:MAG: c-type cytochrome [Desulfatiglandales bacterium]